MNFDLINRGEPDRVNTGVVSHNFFDLLGIKPILGRTFIAKDDVRDAEAVLVLSHPTGAPSSAAIRASSARSSR